MTDWATLACHLQYVSTTNSCFRYLKRGKKSLHLWLMKTSRLYAMFIKKLWKFFLQNHRNNFHSNTKYKTVSYIFIKQLQNNVCMTKKQRIYQISLFERHYAREEKRHCFWQSANHELSVFAIKLDVTPSQPGE